MQGVPIKFRGKPILSSESEYIYGDYVTWQDGCAIRCRENENLFHIHEYEIAVIPQSVAQLVGYDVHGKEIYEGDILCAPYGAIKNFQAGVVILQAMCDDFGTKIVLDYDSIKDNKLILKKGNGNE